VLDLDLKDVLHKGVHISTVKSGSLTSNTQDIIFSHIHIGQPDLNLFQSGHLPFRDIGRSLQKL